MTLLITDETINWFCKIMRVTTVTGVIGAAPRGLHEFSRVLHIPLFLDKKGLGIDGHLIRFPN